MRGLHKAQLFVKRNASTILTGIGGAGVVTTTVMAVKATPKALKSIEEARTNKGDELTTIEKIKVAGPKYIPTIIVGTATVACIFGANILNKRQQAALASAYALLDSSYKEYKGKLKELYGEEAHQEIINAIMIENADDVYVHSECLCMDCDLALEEESDGEPKLFYDEHSNRYIEATIEQILTAEYHLNRNFVLRGYVCLNEFYEFIGVETNDYGSVLGWAVNDEMYWIDFNHRKVVMPDGLEVYIIETPYGPTYEPWNE